MFPRSPHMFCQQIVVGETRRERGEALMFETWTEALLFPRTAIIWKYYKRTGIRVAFCKV